MQDRVPVAWTMVSAICRLCPKTKTEMYCKIADLIVEVPTAGGMYSRCEEYLCDEKNAPDIVIKENLYREKAWPGADEAMKCYMESGVQFYIQLTRFHGIMLHSSAVEMDGKAYLFSGPCGMGKSTHTKLWQQVFGPAAQVFNDDKPALRCIDGKWYAYGTPWCGKDGINQNKKVSLVGICFLKQADVNEVRQMSTFEAVQKIISQTQRRFRTSDNVEYMLSNIENLVNEIPVFELQNRPEPEAVYLSYNTMRSKAEELGL